VIEGGTAAGTAIGSLVLNRAAVSLRTMTVGDVALEHGAARAVGGVDSGARHGPVLTTMERDA